MLERKPTKEAILRPHLKMRLLNRSNLIDKMKSTNKSTRAKDLRKRVNTLYRSFTLTRESRKKRLLGK